VAIIDVLQQLVKSYNATYNSSVGMPPNNVNANNEGTRRNRQRNFVGATMSTTRFESSRRVIRRSPKRYTAKWTRELLKIVSRLPTVPVTYTLSDLMDEPIKGKFYEPELQKVTPRERFANDRILKTRRSANGKTACYVS